MERVVDRSELLSEASTAPSSPDIKNLKSLEEFEFVSHDNKVTEPDQGQNADDDEMDFLLFAPSTNQANDTAELAKIRVQTPPLTIGEPGFVVPDRDDGYYFTKELSPEAKAILSQAAVTGEDVLSRSRSSWPGSSYPWKVLQINNTKRQRIILSNSNTLFAKLCDHPTDAKRRRPGKKARVKVRTKAAAAKARKDENRKAAEEKEAEEREKRTRRNREKKVKKKQREKAKKSETAVAEEDEMSQGLD
ncbi:hypothetical protein PRZ48_004044 [Zasmidium cellare]|uniref:Uncharacterized protein n=1 Tax=Zasmidium cellare TaxID=395010 RepID=A0ABR0EWR1_ZASCE|nr:hypothetical protein PRZ48_004044 [Zasmidium cellare]